MKRLLKAVLATGSLVLVCALPCRAALDLAKWTFETSPPANLDNSTTISGIGADSGVMLASSSASGVHAGVATDWRTPDGNGSANSLSANAWAVNDYWQFTTSSSGYQGIQLDWDQGSSLRGPSLFVLQWSVNGGGYTTVGSAYSLLDVVTAPLASNPNLWRSSTALSTTHFSVDLSLIVELNNAASMSFRLVDFSTAAVLTGSTVLGLATSRVDNFAVSGDVLAAVPEASTWYAGIGLSLGMLGTFVRRIRK